MIDLKEVITKYPESLESATRFRAYMADLYPERADQVRIKVLADVISCGIVDEIMAGNVDNLSISRYRKQMEDRYGYSGRLVAESITKWVQAYAPSDEFANQLPRQAAPVPEIFDIDTIHIHSFEDTEISATCRERGYTLHRCKCGYERRDRFTPFGEHQFEVVDEVFPSCIEDGRRDLLCAVCSEYKSESIPKTKHILSEWVVVQEAGCETVGLSERKCKTCTKTESKQIPALAHDWSGWVSRVYPTCTETGKQIRQCSRCKIIEERELPATGHKFSKWVESKTQKGMQERFCKNCGLEEYCIDPDFEIQDGRLMLYSGDKEIIEIPNGVTSISNEAFQNNRRLTSVIIPSGVTEIEQGSFKDCRSLDKVVLPKTITTIGAYAFCGCTSLSDITFLTGVTHIGYKAFYYCESLVSLIIPTSVICIDSDAFSGCSRLTSISIPNSVAEIGERAFFNCNSLANIVLSSGVKKIGKSAFDGCSSLTSIAIPNSMTRIEPYVFAGCSSLMSITIPNSVTKIAGRVFWGCKNLTIFTSRGSCAEKYAETWHIPCSPLNLADLEEERRVAEERATKEHYIAEIKKWLKHIAEVKAAEERRVEEESAIEKRHIGEETAVKERCIAEAKAAEQRRKVQIDALNSRKDSLSAELANLHGLFCGKRRKEIEDWIEKINADLIELGDENQKAE